MSKPTYFILSILTLRLTKILELITFDEFNLVIAITAFKLEVHGTRARHLLGGPAICLIGCEWLIATRLCGAIHSKWEWIVSLCTTILSLAATQCMWQSNLIMIAIFISPMSNVFPTSVQIYIYASGLACDTVMSISQYGYKVGKVRCCKFSLLEYQPAISPHWQVSQPVYIHRLIMVRRTVVRCNWQKKHNHLIIGTTPHPGPVPVFARVKSRQILREIQAWSTLTFPSVPWRQ